MVYPCRELCSCSDHAPTCLCAGHGCRQQWQVVCWTQHEEGFSLAGGMDWTAPLCLGVLPRKCQSWFKCGTALPVTGCCVPWWFFGLIWADVSGCCSLPSSKSHLLLPKNGAVQQRSRLSPWLRKQGSSVKRTSHFCCCYTWKKGS